MQKNTEIQSWQYVPDVMCQVKTSLWAWSTLLMKYDTTEQNDVKNFYPSVSHDLHLLKPWAWIQLL